MVQFVNSRCSSVMLNYHSITKLIISLTLTPLQCYFFNTPGVDYIYTGSVDLTLGFLLCTKTSGLGTATQCCIRVQCRVLVTNKLSRGGTFKEIKLIK